MRRHRYVGPAEIRDRERGERGAVILGPAVAAALAGAGVAVPAGFNYSFVFRRCPRCGQTNLIKEAWFVCACCDAELPVVWNFGEV